MPLLGATVEASREKRIERQQARFRDRGGIFQPSEHNALLDILLARGVNGESPSRANSPKRSRSRSASPARKDQTSQPSHHVAKQPAQRIFSNQRRRKSVPPQRDVGKEDAYIEDQRGEAVADASGPSKPSARVKAERLLKLAAKNKRPHSATHASDDHLDASIAKASTAGTAKSKPSEKHDEAIVPDPSESAPNRQRPTKRKAASPIPNFDRDLPSDEEPLAPRKKVKTKASATSKVKATSSKSRPPTRPPTVEGEGAKQGSGREPAESLNRGTKEANAGDNSRGIPNNAEHREVATPTTQSSRSRASHKVKRKAVVTENGSTENVTLAQGSALLTRGKPARPRKKTVRTKATPQPVDDNDADWTAQSTRLRKEKRVQRSVEDPDDDLADSVPSDTSRGIRTDRRQTMLAGDGGDLDSSTTHHKDLNRQSSSPDLPLVKPSRTSAKRRPPEPHTCIGGAQERPAPGKKRRVHEDQDASRSATKDPLVNSRERRQAKLPPQPDSPARIASRTKAPPVLAPKGAKLKPKPKPRMSMFPAPPVDEDSDKDPIDFLS
ncbi:hypothetical protein OH77DRAFT_1590790 [Trametes cingulata]|nr:hypothetical protein OH77DRAFT_1590790 [Trametes cingulata]